MRRFGKIGARPALPLEKHGCKRVEHLFLRCHGLEEVFGYAKDKSVVFPLRSSNHLGLVRLTLARVLFTGVATEALAGLESNTAMPTCERGQPASAFLCQCLAIARFSLECWLNLLIRDLITQIWLTCTLSLSRANLGFERRRAP